MAKVKFTLAFFFFPGEVHFGFTLLIHVLFFYIFAPSSQARSCVLIMKRWQNRHDCQQGKPETTCFLNIKKTYGNKQCEWHDGYGCQ